MILEIIKVNFVVYHSMFNKCKLIKLLFPFAIIFTFSKFYNTPRISYTYYIKQHCFMFRFINLIRINYRNH